MRMNLLLGVLFLLSASAGSAFAVGGGDITFPLTKADPVVFSHDYHSKVRGIKCAACHFQQFSQGATYAMNKETLTKRNFCEHCHNGLKSFDAESSNNCVRCHKKPSEGGPKP